MAVDVSAEHDTILEFPCRFPIKAMGRNADDFEALVSGIVFAHAEAWEGSEPRAVPSAAGNFVSVTIEVEATSKAQLDRIYQDLTDCERVLMAL